LEIALNWNKEKADGIFIFELLGQKILSRTKPGDHLKTPFPHINYNNNE
jgi:hypothetical protein